jgi:hypothetical protein
MKVVQFEDVTPVRGLEHRGGTFHSRTTAAGVPGTPGNFKFSISELGTDYSGPRHRHNFDQYRFMLSGESDYGQDGPLKAGMLGYYPEGVPYGPQVNKTPIVCAVLQFGGASGSGYLQPREVKAGMEELKKFGEIKGVPGAAEKLFGVFTERRTQARLLKLAPGTSYEVAGRGVYLVLSGAGEADGKPLQKFTTVFLDTDETATLRASETAELLHYGLPDLSDLEISLAGAAVQAAE